MQDLDARADLLRHQRDHLPELAEIAELRQTRVRLDAEVRDARIAVDDLTAEQEKVDADVELVKARRSRDQQRMDQGLITNPRDLERMTHELVSLERRIGSLEDDEIEIMERLEEAQGTLDSLTAQAAAADDRLAALASSRDAKAADIDAQLAAVAGSGSRPSPGCRTTWSRSTTSSAAASPVSAPPPSAPASAEAAGSPSTTPSSRSSRPHPATR